MLISIIGRSLDRVDIMKFIFLILLFCFFLLAPVYSYSDDIDEIDDSSDVTTSQTIVPDSMESSRFGLKSYSLLTGVIGVTGLALTGGANDTYPLFTPMTVFGFGTLASALLFDIASWTGVEGDTTNIHEYKRIYAQLGYVSQNNHQDHYRDFYNYRLQFTHHNWFYRINYEHEAERNYEEIVGSVGRSIINTEEFYLTIIPEAKHKTSSEGFSLFQAYILTDLEVNLSEFYSRIEGVYLFNQFGLGHEWFWFEKGHHGYSNEIMILGQGIRFSPSRSIELSTQYKRREDELVGSRNWTFIHLEHSATWSLSSFYIKLLFTHGQGYRLSMSAGATL